MIKSDIHKLQKQVSTKQSTHLKRNLDADFFGKLLTEQAATGARPANYCMFENLGLKKIESD
jgi:hypothetical protein